MQRLQDSSSFKSPNSDMESRVRDRRLLGAWIQRSTGFRVSGFRDSRRQGFLPFGSPDAETPKRRPTATCPFDGRRRPSTKIDGRGLFGMINGHDQIPAFLNLNHTSRHFEASVIGISRLAKTRVLCPFVSRVPKRRSAYQRPRVLYRWTVQALPWTMGSMVPIPSSLAREKGGRGINACVSFLNQTVITDPGILRRDPVRALLAKAERGRGIIIHVSSLR
jgi:hypothetical protein